MTSLPLMAPTGFRAVIFDFGGVFTTSPLVAFAAFERREDLPPNFLTSVIRDSGHKGAFARLERGEIDHDEFDALFAVETNSAGREVHGRTLVSLLMLDLRGEMVEALRRIKQAGLLAGCITNNMPAMDAARMAGPDIAPEAIREVFAMFDRVIESAKAGVRKPEPEIYEMMLSALGVDATQCIFIDDLGPNLKPAQAMGMRTIKAPLDGPEPVISELEALLGLSLRA